MTDAQITTPGPVPGILWGRPTPPPADPAGGWGAGTVKAPVQPRTRYATAHDLTVAGMLAAGWQVQAATGYGTYLHKPLNHLLHFLLGLATAGLWWWVWLVLALRTRRHYVPINLAAPDPRWGRR